MSGAAFFFLLLFYPEHGLWLHFLKKKKKKLEPICELYRVSSNKAVTDGGGGFKKGKKALCMQF